MFTASYFQHLSDRKVRCLLCPHHCLLTDKKRGICLTRQNIGGILYSLNYCRPVSGAIDPIEKKPLYHFFPGSSIYSTGPNGCNLKCIFCQNCEISQQLIPSSEVSPKAMVADIVSSKTIGCAYTYSEPLIWYETIMAVGPALREHGLKNVLVTNGFVEPGPLNDLLGFVDAMNIDIKSIDPAFYRKLCKARLEPVLRACETVKKQCHLEITNLVVTGENDTEENLRGLARYIAENLGRDTPLHLSRYFPRHRMDAPTTPLATLTAAWNVAREFLDYVYTGNLATNAKSDTLCQSCGTTIIRRSGYRTELLASPRSANILTCPNCSASVPIITS